MSRFILFSVAGIDKFREKAVSLMIPERSLKIFRYCYTHF